MKLKYYRLPLNDLETQLTENMRGAQLLLRQVTRETTLPPGIAAVRGIGDAKLAKMSYAIFGKESADDKASLISVFGQTLRRFGMLEQVEKTVAQTTSEISTQSGVAVTYNGFVPQSMKKLEIGPVGQR